MRPRLLMLLFALATLLPLVARSATVTATCKDGTTFSGPSRSGACKDHQGVASWGEATPLGAATTGGSTATAAKSQPSATSTTQVPAATTPRSTTAAAAQPPTSTKSAAPGGGPGQVWVNSSSKVYHCAGSKWYGKTKSGKYMSEADAKAQGFHPVGGKACTA